MSPREPWHALLAPLPGGATPTRTPIPGGETPGSAIAGWRQLALHLSSPAGLRSLLVVLDGSGAPIAASDHVLYLGAEQREGATITTFEHQSIGGRLEHDGTFKGTCWSSNASETGSGETHDAPPPRPSEPTPEQVARLRQLVEELCRR